MSKTACVTIVASVAALGLTGAQMNVAGAEPPLRHDGPTPPAPQSPATLEEAQAASPPGTCANDPHQPKCPRVTRVEYVRRDPASDVTTLAEESWSSYVPLASASASGPIPPGYGCAHLEKKPYKVVYPSGNDVARTYTDHKCRESFSYVETSLCLQRYGDPRPGDWGNLNCDTDTAGGGVEFRTQVQYDCNHPDSTWAYRNHSVLYSVRQGTGYVDIGTAYNNISYCTD
jgi:hypothetical protein